MKQGKTMLWRETGQLPSFGGIPTGHCRSRAGGRGRQQVSKLTLFVRCNYGFVDDTDWDFFLTFAR